MFPILLLLNRLWCIRIDPIRPILRYILRPLRHCQRSQTLLKKSSSLCLLLHLAAILLAITFNGAAERPLALDLRLRGLLVFLARPQRLHKRRAATNHLFTEAKALFLGRGRFGFLGGLIQVLPLIIVLLDGV